MNVAEASRNLPELVDRVHHEGVTIDLERGNKVVARLVPVRAKRSLTVGELNAFLRGLPALGDDADAFSKDVDAVRRSFPPETDPWA